MTENHPPLSKDTKSPGAGYSFIELVFFIPVAIGSVFAPVASLFTKDPAHTMTVLMVPEIFMIAIAFTWIVYRMMKSGGMLEESNDGKKGFTIGDVMLGLPLMFFGIGLIPAVWMASLSPERAAAMITLPLTGTIAGAALIVFVWYRGFLRKRANERQLASDVENFLAGAVK